MGSGKRTLSSNRIREHDNIGPYASGEDPDIKRLEERGNVIISSETYLPTPNGRDVFDTYNAEQKLKERRREMELEQKYDHRFEGRSEGYYDDPDNYSNSGLKT